MSINVLLRLFAIGNEKHENMVHFFSCAHENSHKNKPEQEN